ncbi:CapA family protein [Microbacterium sp. NRRL B-14842]|uniref:CapA family protein n=1 Tax=Microbacterium sp. NRRL B-14842 TaxID=3162881 RepID=UPI003D2D5056
MRPWFTEDIVTGNLEQVIAADTGVDKCGGSDHCLAFRSEPDAVEALRGFDVLNQANNHSHDFGRRASTRRGRSSAQRAWTRSATGTRSS